MYRRRGSCLVVGILLALAAGLPAGAAERPEVQQAIAQLGPAAEVKVNPATGAARFVRLPESAPSAGLAKAARGAASAAGPQRADQTAADFLRAYAGLFGLNDPDRELRLVGSEADPLGGEHLTYTQEHQGVPVFAATLKAHFDASGQLRVVNGVTVPDVTVDATPRKSAQEAGAVAVGQVKTQKGDGLSVRATTLFVYRAGLLKGVAGPNHLVWQVEVGNGMDVREFVFVDAQSGKIVDQYTGIHDAMFRRAYNGLGLPTVPPSYPGAPFWVEGNAFPTAIAEANNMLYASEETYGLFSSAFGRDSWDGAGAMMDQIFNRGYGCPNASWNGVFISFCPGFTTDDVTAHEWGHAYTERTHGLIYAWQPGALNESYSDIWGETVDRINARGANDPGPPRSADGSLCSSFTTFPVMYRVNSPASIQGDYPAGSAAFGPYPTGTGTTGDLVYADVPLACTPPTNVAGKVALIDRGVCTFAIKVKNAQLAGAIAVVIADNAGGNAISGMAGVDPTITIPSIKVSQNAGALIKGTLAGSPVNGTVRSAAPASTDASNRWLMGEDVTPGGALRDMWNPTCYGNPGKVTDAEYFCGTGDSGGVHLNSGIPNHAYALLVDGGTYNGQTINALGLTKTAHVYFRAQAVYQHQATDFAEHADALQQSCADLALAGTNLNDLLTGAPSGQVITAADCAEVAKVMTAVQMRTPPDQCGFQPLLAKNPPDRCEAGKLQANVFTDGFDNNPIGPWTVSHTAVDPSFTPREWQWVTGLPDEREGNAFFAIDPNIGTCGPGGDESGVLHAASPVITLPPGAAAPRLTFDHWVATEPGYDGGNVSISVNGAPFVPVAKADFTYNAYNTMLITAAGGNTNPLAGQDGFSGSDAGSVDGSWGRSHVNLGPYAGPGDTVQLKFDFGTDGCGGTFGWILDDPTVYACVPNSPPLISINDITVTEGNSGWTNADFKVTLSHASPTPTSVVFVTLPGTAFPILDFALDLGKVTIPPLHLEATVRVKVRGERLREKDETFFVLLLLPHGGAILDGAGKGTILNDDGR